MFRIVLFAYSFDTSLIFFLISYKFSFYFPHRHLEIRKLGVYEFFVSRKRHSKNDHAGLVV
jgi:hypothetical protein